MVGFIVAVAVGAVALWVAGRQEWIDQGDLYAAAVAALGVAVTGWLLFGMPTQTAALIVAIVFGGLALFAWRALLLLGATIAVGAIAGFLLIPDDVVAPPPLIDDVGPSVAAAN